MASLFAAKKPVSKPVVAMPDEGDPNVQAAERRKRQGMMARGGRASTILSEGAGTGSNMPQEYTGQQVGGA